MFQSKTFLLLLLFAAATPQIFAQKHPGDCGAHPTNQELATEHCAMLHLVHEDSATHIAAADGSWFAPATWTGGAVPGAGAKVWIPAGISVFYDAVSDANVFTLRVSGSLTFSTSENTRLKINTLIVDPSGELTIGTVGTPVASNRIAEIIFANTGAINTVWDPFTLSKSFISHGLTTVCGASKRSFCNLSTAPAAGANVLKCLETPTGWRVGDQIVLAGTFATYSGSNSNNTRFHDEELTITQIVGKNIYFTNNANGSNSLLYAHQPPSGFGLRVQVANLTRNVRFETEAFSTIPVMQRGHFMLMHNADQSLRYAGFYGLGRTNKNAMGTRPVVDSNFVLVSGGENPLGRYACHVHRAGAGNINSNPVRIIGCALRNTPGWGFVNHDSHVVMEDNVAYEFRGAAFITEDGNELGAFRRNIAIKGIGDDDPDIDIEVSPRVSNFDLGFNGEGFWMQSANVVYEDNIAASCAGSAFFLFTDDDVFGNPELQIRRPLIAKTNILHPEIAGTWDSIFNRFIPIRRQKGHIAYNCHRGMGFWMHKRNQENVGRHTFDAQDRYNHIAFSVVEDFKFWGLLNNGLELSYTSQLHFKNGLILGDLANRFANSTWPADRFTRGVGIQDNSVTGQTIFENIEMQGWNRAMPALRTFNGFVPNPANQHEYDYLSSELRGGTFKNNNIHLFPEHGHFDYQVFPFAKFFKISNSPTFTPLGSNTKPTAQFSSRPVGGTTVFFDAMASSDGDAGVPVFGNGIAAYTWDFGDGTTGHGGENFHFYQNSGTFTVVLKVFDSKGATSTLMKTVVVGAIDSGNPFKNPCFASPINPEHWMMNSTRDFVNRGWFHRWPWTVNSGGEAVISGGWGYETPLLQVVDNHKILRGNQTLNFRAKNMGPGSASRSLTVQIIGINGEFINRDYVNQSGDVAWNNADTNFQKVILLNENIGGSTFDWTNFSRTVNFGGGFDFLILKIFSGTGLNNNPTAQQGVDDFIIGSPTVAIAGPAILCGASTQQYSLPTMAIGSTWAWTVTGGTILEGQNTNAPTFRFTTNGSKTISATVTEAGCSRTFSRNITVSALPNAKVTAAGATTFCDPGQVILNAVNNNLYTYQWLKNDVPISGATNFSYAAAETGAFKCVVTTNAGCSKTSTATQVNEIQCGTTASENLENAAADFSIFPNPASEQLFFNGTRAAGEVVEIFSVSGAFVKNWLDVGQPLDISGLAAGVYFVRVGGLQRRFLKI